MTTDTPRIYGYGRVVIELQIGHDIWHEVVTHHTLVNWQVAGDIRFDLASGFQFTVPKGGGTMRATCFFGPWSFVVVPAFMAEEGRTIWVGPEKEAKHEKA